MIFPYSSAMQREDTQDGNRHQEIHSESADVPHGLGRAEVNSA